MSRSFESSGSRHRRGLAAAALTLALLASACSTKADQSSDPTGGARATGPGVTPEVIKLGVLTDRTGPFAPASVAAEQGRNLFWDAKNANGGVCDRKVEFLVKDHGYNAQSAVTAYAQVKDQVLALDELLGSPMIAALLPDLEADKMLTMAASWSSSLLANPYVVITGSTYDVEMINGIHWLTENKGLAKGDKIGHIYLEGDYGENAVAGSRAAAKELGLELVEHKIKPTDTDLTGPITSLEGDGIDFVLLTTTPPQTASAVGVAAASGYDASFLGSNPSFSAALLATPVKNALEKQLLVTTSIAPFASKAAGPTRVRDAFQAKYPDKLQSGFVMYGYAQGEIMAEILESACKKDALTRDGLLDAFQSLQDVQTDGLVPALDYSKPGEIPTREVYLVQPDSTVPGGLVEVQPMFAAPFAIDYQPSR